MEIKITLNIEEAENSIEEREKTYSEMQDEWIRENGVSLGNLVKIGRKPDETYGWKLTWTNGMSGMIGKAGLIEHIDSERGIRLGMPNMEAPKFWYPFNALEKIGTLNIGD